MKMILKRKLMWPVAAVCFVLLVSTGGNGLAQEYEYEADEGLHQEEWYDPSDWFDYEDGSVDYEED